MVPGRVAQSLKSDVILNRTLPALRFQSRFILSFAIFAPGSMPLYLRVLLKLQVFQSADQFVSFKHANNQ